MTIQRMDHVGIIVDDLAAAIDVLVELGLEVQGQFSVEDIDAAVAGLRARGTELVGELAEKIG